MDSILIETMCLPPIPVMSTIVRHSTLLLEAHEHYQKRSFRNRIHLNGPQGKVSFSIPLRSGKNSQMPIKVVRISYETPWQKNFMKQINTNYGSAPYFEYLREDLYKILDQEWEFLWDLNLALYDWVNAELGAPVTIQLSELYEKDVADHIEDKRSHYALKNISDSTQKVVAYQQVFSDQHGFVSHLSILDMLMSCGPESILKLKGIN